MSTEVQITLSKYVNELEKIYGTYFKEVILYGSYARGDFKINSDMDIMILTSLSDSEIKELEKKVYDIAFEYELMHDVMISVNIKNEEQLQKKKGLLESTLQDSSFDIELEYEIQMEEPYDKNRINTDHLEITN